MFLGDLSAFSDSEQYCWTSRAECTAAFCITISVWAKGGYSYYLWLKLDVNLICLMIGRWAGASISHFWGNEDSAGYRVVGTWRNAHCTTATDRSCWCHCAAGMQFIADVAYFVNVYSTLYEHHDVCLFFWRRGICSGSCIIRFAQVLVSSLMLLVLLYCLLRHRHAPSTRQSTYLRYVKVTS